MIITRSADDLAQALGAPSHPVGFVPTMGALHAGHASLFAAARDECETLVASIFVNAMQFDRPEDLAKYPRTLESDLQICRSEKVDVVYCPDQTAMYPTGFSTVVSVGRLGRILEGADRPGHFDGVATVVTKLLSSCRADVAYFGQKDFQQLAVIRRLALDLNLGVDIRMVPTVRDHDGLALSSRNIRLSDEGRRRALSIPRSLEAARTEYERPGSTPSSVEEAAKAALEASGMLIHYVVVVDAETFVEADGFDRTSAILVAATVDGVRLIDNALLD